jgi:hypothetical protein
VIVPEGLLFGSTSAHVELRRKLVEEFELLAVVSLPAGVFKPYAGVKTGILVFRRPLSTQDSALNTDARRRPGPTDQRGACAGGENCKRPQATAERGGDILMLWQTTREGPQ